MNLQSVLRVNESESNNYEILSLYVAFIRRDLPELATVFPSHLNDDTIK